MAENERIVPCEACGTEGRIAVGDPDTGHYKPCEYCDGTGGEVIETQPVELVQCDNCLQMFHPEDEGCFIGYHRSYGDCCQCADCVGLAEGVWR